MKPHTKIYMEFFGYNISDFIMCEIPNCGQRAVDINHIEARKMGGNPTGEKDRIENLMGVCRNHHNQYGDKKQFTDWLKSIHLEFMNDNQKA